ncbi:MAG TPA: DUF885 family protein, partial [Caulobacteraceae bacterium]|nr:DUF885 family protein [Caulobacteraceae bacterium]
MLNRRHVLLTAGASLALAGSAAKAAETGAEAQLNRMLADFFTIELDESPELSTSFGLDVGARKADKSKLSHASIASQQHDNRLNTEQLASLKTIDRAALTGMAAVNYDCVLYALDITERGDKAFVYGSGVGSPYMVSQITGSWSQVPDFLDSQHTIETRDDCEAYLSRLDAFARLMDEECERVRRDAGLGVVPPDFAISGALDQMKT